MQHSAPLRTALLLLVVGGCRSSPSTTTSAATSASAPPSASASVSPFSVAASASTSASASASASLSPTAAALVAARPYVLDVPSSYDPKRPTPLVVLLHGYGSSGAEMASLFSAAALADTKGIFIAVPDGTKDVNGRRFWNATDACCNFGGAKVDDVAYLAALLDDVEARWAIDAKRVFLVGHSNGGFFAHRAACELSSRVAAIASIAGPTWKDAARCAPTEPVSVAQIQGDIDTIIHYDGGHMRDDPWRPQYPSAHETIATWASKDGCAGTLDASEVPFDLDPGLPGLETSIEASKGCPKSVAVELWTVHGMGHVPHPGRAWGETIVSFFEAHPKSS